METETLSLVYKALVSKVTEHLTEHPEDLKIFVEKGAVLQVDPHTCPNELLRGSLFIFSGESDDYEATGFIEPLLHTLPVQVRWKDLRLTIPAVPFSVSRKELQDQS
jgi:hypothetical protein